MATCRPSIREQVPAGRRKRLGLRDDNGLVLHFDERKLNGKVNLDIVSLELANLFTGPTWLSTAR